MRAERQLRELPGALSLTLPTTLSAAIGYAEGHSEELMSAPRHACVLALALIATFALDYARPQAAGRKSRPKRLSSAKLRAVLKHALRDKSTLRSLLAKVDRKLRKPAAVAVAFKREPVDERHPALSTPWDLPKSEYPNRAVVRRAVRFGGVPAELQVVTDLRALDPNAGAKLLASRKTTLIVMLTAASRRRALPKKTIERLLRRLGLSVYAAGSLGSCKPAKEWCSRRRYSFLGKRGRRKGTLLLQLAQGKIGGLKLIAQ
jgi:hypothetical protein